MEGERRKEERRERMDGWRVGGEGGDRRKDGIEGGQKKTCLQPLSEIGSDKLE